MEKHTQFIRE